MAKAAEPIPRTLERWFTFDRKAVDAENRTVELAFSSEEPYRRRYGMEVLGHRAGEVDLTRIGDGTHPLLWNHDRNVVLGIVESARIDGDKVGRAKVRFSRNFQADEKFKDVQDGILRQVSMAYEVDEDEYESTKDKRGVETRRYRKWKPYEISIVSIAADPTVGIGRDYEPQTEERIMSEQTTAVPPQAPAPPPVDIEKIRREAREAESRRYNEIEVITHDFRHFDLQALANKAKAEGMSEPDFRKLVMDHIRDKAKATVGTALARVDQNTQKRSRSIGQCLVEDGGFIERPHVKGKSRRESVLISDRDHFREALQRTTLNSETGTDLVAITDLPGLVVPDRRVLRIADIIPSGTITGNSLRYLQETSYTQAATAVAEGAAKPEATLVLNQVTGNVEKIAVYTKVTEEMFMDFPVVRSYVDNTLSYMVRQEEERQLLSGSGASNQQTGLLNVSGIQTQSATGLSLPHDAFMKAFTKIRVIGNVEPNWVVVNPYDWENLKLTKDSNGQYLGGGPFSGQYGVGPYSNIGQIWGVPAVVTAAISQGTALALNSIVACQLFRRTGLMLESTNTDQDDFIKNLMTIRAEQYELLATYKPLAICSITDIPAV